MEEMNSFKVIKEENYIKTMEEEVLPYLSQYKKTGKLAVKDGEIYYETYINPNEKASVVISHGFCEFCGKLEEVIYYFFRAGYSVFIMEHRGHGRSSRMGGAANEIYIESYHTYVTDFHQFVVDIVKKQSKTGKLVLYAHSMGGAIGALVLEHYPELFSCAILTSPMLELDSDGFSNRLTWIVLGAVGLNRHMKKLAPGEKRFNKEPEFEQSGAMSEPRYMRVHEARLKDEALQSGGATYAWVTASLKAVRILQKNAYRIKTPLVVFQAENDTMVKPRGQELFVSKVEGAELIKIKDSKHEIYNATDEIIQAYFPQVFAFIEKWI